LYFKAWADTVEIMTEWEQYGSYLLDKAEGEDDSHTDEWHAYIKAAQSDLQAIHTLIQQSQEIGLKATICELSVFASKANGCPANRSGQRSVGLYRLSDNRRQ
jgi:hypothetical protein